MQATNVAIAMLPMARPMPAGASSAAHPSCPRGSAGTGAVTTGCGARCSRRARGPHSRAMILAYLARRVAYGAVTVLGVLLLLFVLFFLVTNPDDIARRALGEKAPPEAITQWKVNHGNAKPPS